MKYFPKSTTRMAALAGSLVAALAVPVPLLASDMTVSRPGVSHVYVYAADGTLGTYSSFVGSLTAINFRHVEVNLT